MCVPLGGARSTNNNLYQVYDMILNGLDDSTNFLSQILPWLNQLTVLRLGDLTVGVFPLERLLAGCPRLLYLHLHGLPKPKGGNHPLIDFFPEVDATVENDIRTRSEDTSRLKTPLRLRGLRLEHVWIKETVHFTLLNHSPDMFQLNLQLPSIYPRTHHDLGGSLATLDRLEFFEYMAGHYPHLTSLQFTRAAVKFPLQDVSCATVEALPNATEWVIFLRDLLPPLFQSLLSVYSPSGPPFVSWSLGPYFQPMLTSLTIVYTTIFDESEDNSLHRFLCEIPTLLHLRAESVPYPIENMD